MQPGCNPLNGSRMHRSEWKSRAGLHARRRPDRSGVKTMLICSLAFLVVALLMAMLDSGPAIGYMLWVMQPKKQNGVMRLLIIDDEENIRRTTAVALEAIGYETTCVEDRAAALKQLENGRFDIAFLDLKLNGESGLDLLPELLEIDPRLEVVVFTAYASIETAVEAMRRGAVDYLPKPFTPDQIRQALSRLIQARKLSARVAELESRLASDAPTTDLATSEPAMQKVLDLAF